MTKIWIYILSVLMRPSLAVCLVLFCLVLLTTALRVAWPNVILFALSLVFLANHLAIAHGVIFKFRIGTGSLGSLPHGYAANVSLSYLGLVIVVVSSLVRGIGGDSGPAWGDSGKDGKGEEFALIGAGGGGLGDGVAPGGDDFGDGSEHMGSGEGEGISSGIGQETEGHGDFVEIADVEDIPMALVEEATGERVYESAETIPEEKVPDKAEEEIFLGARSERFTLSFDPKTQFPAPIGPRSSSRLVRGGSSAYGAVASIDGSGTVVKPDKDTSILIYFDSSGSMNTTFEPLQVMRDTILRAALLPCYGSIELYEERVRVLSEPDERGLAWLTKGFEMSKSVVFIFQDESDGTYYNSSERLQSIFLPDMYQMRKAIEEFDGSYYRGVVFQVRNKKEGSHFQRFLRKTFQAPPVKRANFGQLSRQSGFFGSSRRRSGNSFTKSSPVAFDPAAVPPRTPAHLADFLRRSGPISFDLKTNQADGATPEYYLKRITMAARELGIDLSAVEQG